MRICSACGEPFVAGYKVFDEYFCNDECLHTKYTTEVFNKLYCDDNCDNCNNTKCDGSKDTDNAYYSSFLQERFVLTILDDGSVCNMFIFGSFTPAKKAFNAIVKNHAKKHDNVLIADEELDGEEYYNDYGFEVRIDSASSE